MVRTTAIYPCSSACVIYIPYTGTKTAPDQGFGLSGGERYQSQPLPSGGSPLISGQPVIWSHQQPGNIQALPSTCGPTGEHHQQPGGHYQSRNIQVLPPLTSEHHQWPQNNQAPPPTGQSGNIQALPPSTSEQHQWPGSIRTPLLPICKIFKLFGQFIIPIINPYMQIGGLLL